MKLSFFIVQGLGKMEIWSGKIREFKNLKFVATGE